MRVIYLILEIKFSNSHQQTNFLNTVQVAAHYTAHIGIAPSILVDRKSPEVSLLKICIIALCNCFTFCQTFIAPCLYFNTLFQHFFV